MRAMRTWHVAAVISAVALLAMACNDTGLSKTPRATFSEVACLDVNGDHRINSGDAADPSKLPDFNADNRRNAEDAAFLENVDIELKPDANVCGKGTPDEPEFAVAHGYFSPAEVSCADGNEPVLLLGIGGGVVNLKDRGSAAGVRQIVSDLQVSYDKRHIDTLTVLGGPTVAGAPNIHTAAEQWLTNVVRVYLEKYPCLRVVIVGHSHGAVTADVVAAHLEPQYAGRFIVDVDLDRVEALYTGDTQSRPTVIPVFNVYETNDPALSGHPYDAPNAENWDASGEQGPAAGDEGGPLKQVNHTTIDNSRSVRERIVAEVMERS